MTSPAAAAALAAICGLVTAIIWLIGLPRVPEPADTDGSELKVPYVALAQPRAAALVAVFSVVTALIELPRLCSLKFPTRRHQSA